MTLDACYGGKRGQQAGESAERPRRFVNRFRGRSGAGSVPVHGMAPQNLSPDKHVDVRVDSDEDRGSTPLASSPESFAVCHAVALAKADLLLNEYAQQSKATRRTRAHSQSPAAAGRIKDKSLDEFPTQCFGSAMRRRIAFFHDGNTKERLTKRSSIKCMKAASIRGKRSPKGKEFLLILDSKLAIRVA